MTFNEYQTAAHSFSRSHNHDDLVWTAYAALGLAGEAGEVANKVKKIIRDHNGWISDEMRTNLVGELGDVLWYVSELAEMLECKLDLVAMNNLFKLDSRNQRSKIQGEGDNR